ARAVFEHQTVAGLAGVADVIGEPCGAVADIATGGLAPTPIMRWLLERGGALDRFNQAMLLQVPAGVRGADLISALQAVLDHHDGLRVGLGGAGGGGGGGVGGGGGAGGGGGGCLWVGGGWGWGCVGGGVHLRACARGGEPAFAGGGSAGAGGVV